MLTLILALAALILGILVAVGVGPSWRLAGIAIVLLAVIPLLGRFVA
jgi:hypothetical protein